MKLFADSIVLNVQRLVTSSGKEYELVQLKSYTVDGEPLFGGGAIDFMDFNMGNFKEDLQNKVPVTFDIGPARGGRGVDCMFITAGHVSDRSAAGQNSSDSGDDSSQE